MGAIDWLLFIAFEVLHTYNYNLIVHTEKLITINKYDTNAN